MDEEAAKRVAVESARAMFMRPSERAAVSALERVINDAQLAGFQKAMLMVEQAVFSVDSLEDLLKWIKAMQPPSASTPAGEPPSKEA